MTRAPSESPESPGSSTTPAPSFPSIKGAVARKRAEPPSLPGVCHNETDVSCPFLGKTVPRHSDQLRLLSVVDFGDDGHLPVIVDVGEDVGFLRKEPPDGEESLIHRLRAQATAQRHQAGLVVGADRGPAPRRRCAG